MTSVDDTAGEQARAFGRWVQARRMQRRLSRAKLASIAGVSQSTVKGIEDGGRMMNGAWMTASPGERILLGLADGLEERPADVFEAAGVPVPEHLKNKPANRRATLPPGTAAEAAIDVTGLPAEDVEMIAQQVRRLKRLHGLEEP